MTILGIDYGAKKIGLALSDQRERMAMPLQIIPNTNLAAAVQLIQSICQSEQIGKIVVGLPVSLQQNDSTTASIQVVQTFLDKLHQVIQLPIETIDERLSTAEAKKLLVGQGGGDDDAVAAMLILQTYLDRQANS